MASNGVNSSAALLSELKAVETATLTDAERNELVVQLRAALTKVQTPWQQMQALIWENTGHAAALKTAHDLNVFKNWPKDHDAVDFIQLSKAVSPSCNGDLLKKVLNALTYMGTLESPSTDRYQLTEFSKSLRDPSVAVCLDYWFEFQTPALSKLPAFLKSTSYQLPLNPTNTAWNLASGDPNPFFGWLQQRPDKMGIFAQVMQHYSASQLPWTSLYPTENLLPESSTSNAPILVDVGGSLGHDILKFVEKHTPPPGTCYLQDKPEVIEKAIVGQDIIATGHDFFQEQPIKGARAYYLHNILHDWPDAECQTILANLKAALNPTSRILIHEIVGRADAAHDLLSVGEFTVMSILGAPERSEAQYRALVDAAGLRVTQLYVHPLSLHSIIEVGL